MSPRPALNLNPSSRTNSPFQQLMPMAALSLAASAVPNVTETPVSSETPAQLSVLVASDNVQTASPAELQQSVDETIVKVHKDEMESENDPPTTHTLKAGGSSSDTLVGNTDDTTKDCDTEIQVQTPISAAKVRELKALLLQPHRFQQQKTKANSPLMGKNRRTEYTFCAGRECCVRWVYDHDPTPLHHPQNINASSSGGRAQSSNVKTSDQQAVDPGQLQNQLRNVQENQRQDDQNGSPDQPITDQPGSDDGQSIPANPPTSAHEVNDIDINVDDPGTSLMPNVWKEVDLNDTEKAVGTEGPQIQTAPIPLWSRVRDRSVATCGWLRTKTLQGCHWIRYKCGAAAASCRSIFGIE